MKRFVKQQNRKDHTGTALVLL